MALQNSDSSSTSPKTAGSPEGPLDSDIVLFHSTAAEIDPEDYHFTKTDPRSVFLLALAAAIASVLGIAAAHLSMIKSIEWGLLPPSPALQHYVERSQ